MLLKAAPCVFKGQAEQRGRFKVGGSSNKQTAIQYYFDFFLMNILCMPCTKMNQHVCKLINEGLVFQKERKGFSVK